MRSVLDATATAVALPYPRLADAVQMLLRDDSDKCPHVWC